MRLSAKPIINWCDVNMYAFGNQWTINAGDPNTLYFQLIDVDQAIQGNNSGYGIFSGITAVGTTAGVRYLAGIGSSFQPYSVKVTFPSIDSQQFLTVTAVQADPNDSSIFKVSIDPCMNIGGGNVQFALYQGNNINRFSVLNMLGVNFPTDNGSC